MNLILNLIVLLASWFIMFSFFRDVLRSSKILQRIKRATITIEHKAITMYCQYFKIKVRYRIMLIPLR